MRLFRPRHPVVVVFAVVWLSQMVALLAYTLGHDPAGHALEVSPLNALMITVPLYSAWIFGIVGVALLLRHAVSKARTVIAACVAGLALLLIVLTPVDLALQRFRGERLTPSLVRTYFTRDIVNEDWLRPFVESPNYAAMQLLLLGASLFAFALILWRWFRDRNNVNTPALSAGFLSLGLSLVCYLPLRFAYDHQREMGMPAEAVFARALLTPATSMSAAQLVRERDEWRASLDSTGQHRWLSDSFPLMHTNNIRAIKNADSLPDIVLFVVESLRGADVGYGLHPRQGSPSVTPELDALARQSVVFPQYIASGEPSPRGFITIQTGQWEHKHEFTLTGFPNLQTDAIPERLRAKGYHTMALWGVNPSFDNQLTWARCWFDELVFDMPENRLFYLKAMSDGVLMDRFIDRVRNHDRVRPNQPLFAFVASNGTHTPFNLSADAAATADSLPSTDRQRRYDLCLANIDAQIGRVVRFLKARRHGSNTIIVVIGDHSDRTNETFDARWRGMPVDAAVWTAALIHGPERLIGVPRREQFVASHVDLLPTISAFTNDHTPTNSLGHDLFDGTVPVSERRAVSINARGYRLDWQGFTLLVDSRDSRLHYAFKSFAEGSPVPLTMPETPFAPDEAERLARRIEYWSELMEHDRVWSSPLARKH